MSALFELEPFYFTYNSSGPYKWPMTFRAMVHIAGKGYPIGRRQYSREKCVELATAYKECWADATSSVDLGITGAIQLARRFHRHARKVYGGIK